MRTQNACRCYRDAPVPDEVRYDVPGLAFTDRFGVSLSGPGR